jgi:hypothetical protein
MNSISHEVPGPAGAGPPIGRRQFLGWGSLLLASAWLDLPFLSRAAAEEAGGAVFSIGYVLGSDRAAGRWPQAAREGEIGAQVVPAASLPAGDPALAVDGFRMRLAGTYPSARELPEARLPRRVTLDLIAVPDEDRPELRFHAWTLERRSRAVQMSAPVAFRVAFAPHRGVELDLAVEAEGAEPRTARLVWTTEAAPGIPRLVPGVYLVGLGEAIWQHPVRLPDPGETIPPHLLSLVVVVEAEPADGEEPAAASGMRRIVSSAAGGG